MGAPRGPNATWSVLPSYPFGRRRCGGSRTESTVRPTRSSRTVSPAAAVRPISTCVKPWMTEPVSGRSIQKTYCHTSTPVCCAGSEAARKRIPPTTTPDRLRPPLLPAIFAIPPADRGRARRHPLPARQRLPLRLLHLHRHLGLGLLELRRRHAFFLQILLVQSDGIALAPVLEQLG